MYTIPNAQGNLRDTLAASLRNRGQGRYVLDLICYCLRVEKPAIVAAIESGCATVEDLSARLRVCTGCGGCRPDLEDLLRFYRNENAQCAAPKPSAP